MLNFYKLIYEHQIYKYNNKLYKKNINENEIMYKKFFFVFLLNLIRRVDDNLRYIYKQTKKKNR